MLPAHFYDAAGDLFTTVEKFLECSKFWQCSCHIVSCSLTLKRGMRALMPAPCPQPKGCPINTRPRAMPVSKVKVNFPISKFKVKFPGQSGKRVQGQGKGSKPSRPSRKKPSRSRFEVKRLEVKVEIL